MSPGDRIPLAGAWPFVWRGCPRLRVAGACTGSKNVISTPRVFTSGREAALSEPEKRSDEGDRMGIWRGVYGNPMEPSKPRARSLTRLNCAEFRDDAIAESAAGIGQGQRSHRAWLRFPFRTGEESSGRDDRSGNDAAGDHS